MHFTHLPILNPSHIQHLHSGMCGRVRRRLSRHGLHLHVQPDRDTRAPFPIHMQTEVPNLQMPRRLCHGPQIRQPRLRQHSSLQCSLLPTRGHPFAPRDKHLMHTAQRSHPCVLSGGEYPQRPRAVHRNTRPALHMLRNYMLPCTKYMRRGKDRGYCDVQ